MNHPTQEEPAALRLAKALRRGVDHSPWAHHSEEDVLRLRAANELERLHFIINGTKADPAAVIAAAGVVA